jgi:chromosome segregation ATPase
MGSEKSDSSGNGSVTAPTLETVLNRINLLDEKIASRFDSVESRLDRVESRLDRVESRLEGVESRLEGVESHFQSAITELRQDMNSGFRRVERKLDILNRDFLSIRVDNEDLLQRIEKLESNTDNHTNDRGTA